MTKANYLIDINADLGEGFNFDQQLMALITSANIACGGHAGDTTSMRQTVKWAKDYGVRIGAHPSYPDKVNFGRQAVQLTKSALTASLTEQITDLIKVCDELDCQLEYIKPHGALYNKVAVDTTEASVLINTIKSINPKLALMTLAGSPLVDLAKQHNIEVIEEAFADRRYLATGQLSPRSQQGAVIEDVEQVLAQAMAIARGQAIATLDNHTYQINAQSLCLHGDNQHALCSARLICQHLRPK
ncbi:5-oxoprolinase subunit PxpA [Shewanella waksmanii]|uniref:5-oxoprolinase subunit PxpA n=1 Tax=Shewanella waksmanii TaxID=213783 RepID=UPI00373590E6